jgi:hypothetical protein
MKILSFKHFENKENSIEWLISDLYGVEPLSLRDAIYSILSELDLFNIKISYDVSTNFSGNRIFENPYFKWQYNLFLDDGGLKEIDYKTWKKYMEQSGREYSDFPASINLIIDHDINGSWDKLHQIIDFINSNLKEYNINFKANKKFSGFINKDFGEGFMIQLLDNIY